MKLMPGLEKSIFDIATQKFDEATEAAIHDKNVKLASNRASEMLTLYRIGLQRLFVRLTRPTIDIATELGKAGIVIVDVQYPTEGQVDNPDDTDIIERRYEAYSGPSPGVKEELTAEYEGQFRVLGPGEQSDLAGIIQNTTFV